MSRMTTSRKSRFRSDVEKGYLLIKERGLIPDGEFQYLLDVSHGPYYRIKRALLDIHGDVIHDHGAFKMKDLLAKAWDEKPKVNYAKLFPDEEELAKGR